MALLGQPIRSPSTLLLRFRRPQPARDPWPSAHVFPFPSLFLSLPLSLPSLSLCICVCVGVCLSLSLLPRLSCFSVAFAVPTVGRFLPCLPAREKPAPFGMAKKPRDAVRKKHAAQALAKGYKKDAHREQDAKRKRNIHGKSATRNQQNVLDRYLEYVASPFG